MKKTYLIISSLAFLLLTQNNYCQLDNFTINKISYFSSISNQENLDNLINSEFFFDKSMKTELDGQNTANCLYLTPTSEEYKLTDYPTVPESLFVYGNQPRYTMTGNLPYLNSHAKPVNIAIVGGIYAAIFYAQHSVQQSDVWKETGPFHFYEDIQYALWVDKFGHFYGGYSTSYVFTEGLITSGLSWEMSNIIGSVLGLGYMSYIEVLDGYSKGFGFSPSDFYADVLGSGFFLAQYYFPILQNFNPKFMYVNPDWVDEKHRVPHESFIDDYSTQTFWMTINIQNLFGGVVKEYVPDWLELAIGYTAYSLCDPYNPECDPKVSQKVSDAAWGNRKIIISIDYNIVKLLPDGHPFWNWFKQNFKLFKLPSPAIEIGINGRPRYYLVYPFKL